MIIGVGTDLVEIDRIMKACRRPAFLNRVYTEKEQDMFLSEESLSCQEKKTGSSLAGNFAVKESVAKALGTGFRGFGPSDIEVLRDDMGAPSVTLLGNALELSRQLGIQKWHAAISHTDSMATAFVVAEK